MSGPWRRLPDEARDGPREDDPREVEVIVDGRPTRAFADESVATLLLRLGHDHFGTHPKTGAPLAPYCLMGTCFGCTCTIGGRPGSQACLEPVADGLEIETGGAA